eukprot:536445-Pelagomonas_calceolata.AAC.5
MQLLSGILALHITKTKVAQLQTHTREGRGCLPLGQIKFANHLTKCVQQSAWLGRGLQSETVRVLLSAVHTCELSSRHCFHTQLTSTQVWCGVVAGTSLLQLSCPCRQLGRIAAHVGRPPKGNTLQRLQACTQLEDNLHALCMLFAACHVTGIYGNGTEASNAGLHVQQCRHGKAKHGNGTEASKAGLPPDSHAMSLGRTPRTQSRFPGRSLDQGPVWRPSVGLGSPRSHKAPKPGR